MSARMADGNELQAMGMTKCQVAGEGGADESAILSGAGGRGMWRPGGGCDARVEGHAGDMDRAPMDGRLLNPGG